MVNTGGIRSRKPLEKFEFLGSKKVQESSILTLFFFETGLFHLFQFFSSKSFPINVFYEKIEQIRFEKLCKHYNQIEMKRCKVNVSIHIRIHMRSSSQVLAG